MFICSRILNRGIKQKNRKIARLSLMNNDLLGFLAKNSMDDSMVNFNILLSKELWEELVKHSAELEQWGKA